MKKIAFYLSIIAIMASMSGCTDSSHTEKVLSNDGYKDIQITGYRFFGCPDEDTFHTGFEATNANGKHVSGVVCSGFIMGSVIRLD